MERQVFLEALVAYLTAGGRRTVRIFGHGASGKSTLAQDVLALLSADQVNLLATDPYIIEGSLRASVRPIAAPEQKVTACLPVAHELASLTRDIQALQAGMDILTIDNAPWAPQQVLAGYKPILIVEGMSAGFVKSDWFDLSLACRCDAETELARRLGRDVVERGRIADEILTTQALRRQQYESFYAPCEAGADLIIDQSGEVFTLHLQNSQHPLVKWMKERGFYV